MQDLDFWLKLAMQPNGCALWTGDVANHGYGRLQRNGEQWRAHRYAFFLANGYKPPVVRHMCHNPLCCNPKHLLPGDQSDNIRDMVEAGRSAKGEKNGKAKLTSQQIDDIRASGLTCRDLARIYSVTYSHVSKIKRGARW